jgi:uncharacterized protein YunC (DUF1805 family)
MLGIELLGTLKTQPIAVSGKNSVVLTVENNIPFIIINGKKGFIGEFHVNNLFDVLEKQGALTRN